MNKLSLLLLLVVSVGCFASKPKKVVAPIGDAPKTGNIQPKEAPTKEFSWSIQGDSPLAAWSPDLKKLAISADNPLKQGEKFINIFDLTNGNTLIKTIVKGDFAYPEWLNDEMLGFMCVEDTCGPGGAGVYTLTTTGETKMILPLDSDSVAYFYPASDRIIVVVSTNQHNGENPRSKVYQFEPITNKLFALEKSPFQDGLIPNALEAHLCSSYDSSFHTYSDRGKMILLDEKTYQRHVIIEALPMPRYPGDNAGVSPCLAIKLNQAIYYSFDAKINTGRANLIPFHLPAN
jgi:hypothetical protein